MGIYMVGNWPPTCIVYKYLGNRSQDTTSLPKKKSSGAAGGKIIYFGINHVLIIQYASIIIKLEFGRDFVTGNV